jgi:paraquat-inducible protein B
VEFVGVEIGRVVSVTVDYDAVTAHFPISVGAVVYPERIGHLFQGEKTADPDELARRFGDLMSKMVAHGLRAQARSGSLITGQLYIAIDFVPHARRLAFDGTKRPLQIPTAPGTLDDLQAQLSSIATKIDNIPFESLGVRLDKGLGELDTALDRFNTKLLPESEQTLAEARKVFGAATDALSADSPLQSDVRQTLDELNRSARSLRALTDYLSRHPESLLRGVPPDPSPEVQKPAPPTDTSKPKP